MPFGVTFQYHNQKSTSGRFRVLSGSCLTAGGHAPSFINQICIILVNSFAIPDGITVGAGREARACAFSCFRACNMTACSSGVHSLPFFALAISRVSLNSGLSREHMCCHVLPPARVFLSGLGNTPVTQIWGSPFPHGGEILDVGGCTKAVWSVTLLPVTMMLASSASVHQPVPMYWVCSGRSPHSWWLAGTPGPSSFSGSISQKWVLNQNLRNCMGHSKQLAFFCPASAGQRALVVTQWAWPQAPWSLS